MRFGAIANIPRSIILDLASPSTDDADHNPADPKRKLIATDSETSNGRWSDLRLVNGDRAQLHSDIEVIEQPANENLPLIQANSRSDQDGRGNYGPKRHAENGHPTTEFGADEAANPRPWKKT